MQERMTAAMEHDHAAFRTTPLPATVDAATNSFGGIDSRTGSVQLEDATPDGDAHGVSPVTCTQFRGRILDMHLDCLLGDLEFQSDLSVAIATGDQAQHLQLADTQLFLTQMLEQLNRNAVGN